MKTNNRIALLYLDHVHIMGSYNLFVWAVGLSIEFDMGPVWIVLHFGPFALDIVIRKGIMP